MGFFDLRWIEDITPGLKGMVDRGEDLRPVFQPFGVRMLRSVDKNFRMGGRRNGVPRSWKPLSARAIAQRPKGQQARPKILVRTARLKNSTIYDADFNALAVGTMDRRAPKHHQGGRWGAKLRIRETVRVPRHKRTVRVGADYDAKRAGRVRQRAIESTAASRSAALRTRNAERKSQISRDRREAGKRRHTLRNLAVGEAQRRGVSIPRRKQRRGRGKKRTIWVRPHLRHEDYVLSARPIYEFHPEDMAAFNRMALRYLNGGAKPGGTTVNRLGFARPVGAKG